MEEKNSINTENIRITGLKQKNTFLSKIVYLISFFLIDFISIRRKIKLFYSTSKLSEADFIFVEMTSHSFIVKIEKYQMKQKVKYYGKVIRSFEIFKTKFIFNETSGCFQKILIDEEMIVRKKEFFINFVEKKENFEIFKENCEIKEILYGKNITEVELPSISSVIFSNTINLENFYIFIVLFTWSFTDYFEYSLVLFLMTMYTAIVSIYKEIKANNKLRKQIESSKNKVIKLEFIENNFLRKEVNSEDLFPGDLIVLKETNKFFCDAILLKGSCIVDESFLTGESIAIPKSFQEEVYSGSKIIQKSNEECVGIVFKTGFNTKHGLMLKSLLTPRSDTSNRFKNMGKVIKLILLIVCIVFIFYNVYYYLIFSEFIKFYKLIKIEGKIKRFRIILDLSIFKSFIVSFDLVTVLVNPAFTAALKFGIMDTLRKLKRKDVECMQLNAMQEIGLVDIAVFDKTGTLTENNMEVFDSICYKDKKIFEISKSSCHNLQLLKNKETKENEIVGDPMDISMINSTNCLFIDAGNLKLTYKKEEIDIKIIKRIPFSSERKRVCVYLNTLNKFFIVSKGSPEIIKKLIKNVPKNYDKDLQDLSIRGYRVLSFCYKEINDLKEEEKEMQFLGFLVFSNPLKVETSLSIQELHDANIPTIICSGDSIMTSLSIARELNIADNVVMPVINQEYEETEEIIVKEDNERIEMEDTYIKEIKITANDISKPLRWIVTNFSESKKIKTSDLPIAIEGRCFDYLRDTEPEIYKQLLKKCRIYSRMSPENKANLVKDLCQLNREYFFRKNKNDLENGNIDNIIFSDPIESYKLNNKEPLRVLYCGDGANDCGALNNATVGFSLSPNISVAHFIARYPAISKVIESMREGRSLTVTTMGAFRNLFETSMICYIFYGVLLFYCSYFSAYQSMYHDLFVILPLNIILGWFNSNKKLLNINRYSNNKDDKNTKSIKKLDSQIYQIVLKCIKFIIISLITNLAIQTYFMFVDDICECNGIYEIDRDIKLTSTVQYHSRRITVSFLILTIHIFIACMSSCVGKPHREERFKNKYFISFVVIEVIMFVILQISAFTSSNKIKNIFNLCWLGKNEGFLLILLYFGIFAFYFFFLKNSGNILKTKQKRANF